MSINENLKDAGQSVADAAKNVGHKIADGAEKAADWVKEKTGMGGDEKAALIVHAADIRERMDVIGSCGNKLGVVDHVDGGTIKLTRKDSPDGEHHYIPVAWVDHVDTHVHLNKDCGEAKRDWQSVPMGV